MKLKKAIVQIMDRDQLKQVCDDFELFDVDRRSREDMARKVSRAHRVVPELLFAYLMEPEVKAVCELMGESPKGRRNALSERLMASDESRRQLSGKPGAAEAHERAPSPKPLVSAFVESPHFQETGTRFSRLTKVVERLTDEELAEIVQGYYENDQLHNAIILDNKYQRLKKFLKRTTGNEFKIEGRKIVEIKDAPF